MIKTSSNSMYSYMEQPFFSSQLQVSYEMIDPQYNDAVVVTLEKLYDELLTKLHNQAGKKEIFITFDKIDRVILERFGMPTKHVITPGVGLYATYTVCPPSVNALQNHNARMIMDEVKEAVDYKEQDKIKTIDTVSGDDDWCDMLKNVIKSTEELQNAMGKGVIVNNKNAKIIGLPKEYVIHVLTDPDEILSCELTARELTAVILHELGHNFNEIAYSHKLTRDSIVLTDTFIDNIRNKNKSPKESLLIAYAQAHNRPDVLKLRDKNIISVGLTLLHENLKGIKAEMNAGGMYNSERLADQFASKFGVEAELVSALDKVRKFYNKVRYKYLAILPLISAGLFLLIYIITITPVLAVGVAFSHLIPFLSVIASISIVMFITTVFDLFFPDSDITKSQVHGSDFTRYTAIRNDMIRNLRNLNLDKQATKQAIANIETVDYIISKTPKPRKGPFEAVLNFLNGGKQKEMQKIDELLASLSENDLHLASAKLSTLA